MQIGLKVVMSENIVTQEGDPPLPPLPPSIGGKRHLLSVKLGFSINPETITATSVQHQSKFP